MDTCTEKQGKRPLEFTNLGFTKNNGGLKGGGGYYYFVYGSVGFTEEIRQ